MKAIFVRFLDISLKQTRLVVNPTTDEYMTNLGYTTHQVVHATGLSRRQLVYWQKTGLVNPRHQTRGGHARYALTDILLLVILKRLLDNGISLRQCRDRIPELQTRLGQPGADLDQLHLLVRDDLLLLLDSASDYEILNGEQWLFSLADIRDKLIGILHDEPPRRTLQLEMFPVQN